MDHMCSCPEPMAVLPASGTNAHPLPPHHSRPATEQWVKITAAHLAAQCEAADGALAIWCDWLRYLGFPSCLRVRQWMVAAVANWQSSEPQPGAQPATPRWEGHRHRKMLRRLLRVAMQECVVSALADALSRAGLALTGSHTWATNAWFSVNAHGAPVRDFCAARVFTSRVTTAEEVKWLSVRFPQAVHGWFGPPGALLPAVVQAALHNPRALDVVQAMVDAGAQPWRCPPHTNPPYYTGTPNSLSMFSPGVAKLFVQAVVAAAATRPLADTPPGIFWDHNNTMACLDILQAAERWAAGHRHRWVRACAVAANGLAVPKHATWGDPAGPKRASTEVDSAPSHVLAAMLTDMVRVCIPDTDSDQPTAPQSHALRSEYAAMVAWFL